MGCAECVAVARYVAILCVCVCVLKQMTDELVGGLTVGELWNCCKSFRSLAVCKLWFSEDDDG